MSSRRISAPIKLDRVGDGVVTFLRGLPYVRVDMLRGSWEDLGAPLELWVELDTELDRH